jgi:hypothetical protein
MKGSKPTQSSRHLPQLTPDSASSNTEERILLLQPGNPKNIDEQINTPSESSLVTNIKSQSQPTQNKKESSCGNSGSSSSCSCSGGGGCGGGCCCLLLIALGIFSEKAANKPASLHPYTNLTHANVTNTTHTAFILETDVAESGLPLSITNLPSALVEQLMTALAQGALLTFISKLTDKGLRAYGCNEKHITVIRELGCFVALLALNGIPKDSASLFNFGFSYFVSKISDVMGYINNSKSTASLLSSVGDFAGKFGLSEGQTTQEIAKPPENPIYRV